MQAGNIVRSKESIHLILITNHFPFGIGEAFLENEIEFLTEHFHKVTIISKNTQDTTTRYTAPNLKTHRISTKSSFWEIIVAVFAFFTNYTLSIPILIEEWKSLRERKKRGSLANLKKMLHDLFKGLALGNHITKIIRHESPSGKVILYSYWFTSSALSTIFTDNKYCSVKRIARTHRIDLYEEIHPDRYLPFHESMARRLDLILPISSHGERYLKTRISKGTQHKLQISKLGTKFFGRSGQAKQKDGYTLVSCSFLREIKRVDRIIDALALCKEQIHWIHFGDGPLLSNLEAYGLQVFHDKKHITFELRGAITNEGLMEFYTNNFVDLFINTSSSEGIPVSIMEALSFSIPVIALRVGGISEIVNDEHGRLLNENATALELAGSISEIFSLDTDDYKRMRENAWEFWNKNYNATANYTDFIRLIKSLHQ